MTEIRDDLPGLLPPGKSWRGIIASNPVNLSDLVKVKVPALNPDLTFENVRWQSRDATSMPSSGDPCLVLFDNSHEPWVVAWWPF